MAAEQKLAKAQPAEVARRAEQDHYFQPATDIIETPDAVVLKFDMPGVGDYRRQFALAAGVDMNHIAAEVNEGVLTVTIPKAERAKPRKVKIAVA
jgi:HSP20 family molecular chaperone IbpA